jgi:probable rRNA maturation factor
VSNLSLSITAQTGRDFVPFLKRHIAQAYTLLESGRSVSSRLRLRELSLALVGDKKMSDLHEEFMSISGPTDVLTFPIDTDPRGQVVAGEVVICVPEARRQARTRGIPIRLEVLLYAIHGMLHLLGYDDRTASAYRTMHRTEDQLLTKMGLGKVFARGAKEGGAR